MNEPSSQRFRLLFALELLFFVSLTWGFGCVYHDMTASEVRGDFVMQVFAWCAYILICTVISLTFDEHVFWRKDGRYAPFLGLRTNFKRGFAQSTQL